MSYKDKYADAIESQFYDLENRIFDDIIRRIRKTGEITSTADWQLNRLTALGYSSDDIETRIKDTLRATYPEMFELYDKVIDWEYVRNKDLYEQINGKFVPYEENKQLKQWIEAAKEQTVKTLSNFTATLGIVEQVNGQYTFLPLTEFYQKTLDAAMLDISSGAFDYNSTLKRTVQKLVNSGVRTIDYASGYSSRVAVAARRAVMTGASQMAGRINEQNAEALGTEHFEVAWHANARPSHKVWQGKVWTKEQLRTVCGLGTVTGLCGANCYHEYYPFFPGISERNWTDEWLREENAKENQKRTFKGKEYDGYGAVQKQRQMETSMRAQRQKVRLLEAGGADKEDIIIAKARYQGQLQEYKEFSDLMGLTPQMERVYIDGLGRVANSGGLRINPLKGGKNAKTQNELRISSPGSTKSYKRSLLDIKNGKAGLDKRRQNMLNKMPKTGESTRAERGSISIRDLAYLSAATGNEFALFRSKTEDIIVRGDSRSCNVGGKLGDEIINKHYEWVAHSHVDGGPLNASVEDRETLHKLKQSKSIIVGIDGEEIIFKQSLFLG